MMTGKPNRKERETLSYQTTSRKAWKKVKEKAEEIISNVAHNRVKKIQSATFKSAFTQ